jgi:formate dehydrogenase subunit beta
MDNMRTDKIREIAKRLLKEGKVAEVIGFKAGTIPLRTQPFFAKTEEEADQLIWDSNCRINLANYLPRRKGNFAVVAKGCDARNIVNHIVEHQFNRDQVYIIGVPCEGMTDLDLVLAKEPRPILETEEKDGQIILKGKGFETKIKKDEFLRQTCTVCVHRNPTVYDELVCDEVAEQDVDRYVDIKELLEKSNDERWDYYRDMVKDCIRCYACRDACPLCYCHVCFVDETMPQWVGKSQDRTDTLTYHILRAFHCAGRCTDCGACESACPVGIKVRQFTRLLEKDVKELYEYEAGMSLDKTPPLVVYRPDDPQDFIK